MLNKVIYTFGTKIASALINLGIAVIISQFLGASGKGEQGIVITTVTLILIFSNIIGGASLVYLVPRYQIKILLVYSYLWSILICCGFYTVLFFIPLVNEKYIIHVAAISLISAFSAVNMNILLGKEKIKKNNFISFLQTLIIISVLLITYAINHAITFQTYIHALYLSYSIGWLVGFVFIIPHLKTDSHQAKAKNTKILSELFRLGIVNQIATVAQILNFRISYYLIEYFDGKAEVGIYSNSVALIESIWLVSTSITLVQYARIVNTEDDNYSKRLSIDMTKISLFLALILVIPFLLIPAQFYVFLFGIEFSEVRAVLLTLAPGVLLFNVFFVLGHYFSGTGKYYINMIASLVGLLVTVFVGLLLIPEYSVLGAGYTASISYIITTFIVVFIFIKKAHCKITDLLFTKKELVSWYRDVRVYLKTMASGNNE